MTADDENYSHRHSGLPRAAAGAVASVPDEMGPNGVYYDDHHAPQPSNNKGELHWMVSAAATPSTRDNNRQRSTSSSSPSSTAVAQNRLLSTRQRQSSLDLLAHGWRYQNRFMPSSAAVAKPWSVFLKMMMIILCVNSSVC